MLFVLKKRIGFFISAHKNYLFINRLPADATLWFSYYDLCLLAKAKKDSKLLSGNLSYVLILRPAYKAFGF